MGNWIDKLELEGEKVKLVPLDSSHKEELLKVASDGKLWELWFTSVPSCKNIDNYIAHALEQKKKGLQYPFVVINKNTREVIGCTRYYDLYPENRRLDIGYTWYAKKYQRTGVNTEAKFLLLSHAFERLNCIAVQFVTNWYNLPSRAAIKRLGAKQDGVLRNHQINPDGSYRDTVVFSITDREWSGVKKSLEYEMSKYDS